jgi:Iap family predicted aminopeptidase
LESPELPIMAAGLIDTIGGRLPGTAAGTRAEAWAAGWLRDSGFDSVWHEVVHIPVWRRGATSVQVVTPAALQRRPLPALSYGYSPGLEADSVPVIDIGRGDAASLAELGRRAQGAALLTDAVSAEVVARAAEVGALVLLRISFEPGRLPQARVVPTAEPPAPLAVLALSHEDGLWMRRQAAVGPLAVRLSVAAETRPGTVLNVVGELAGSDTAVADEVFLLGAHLDSWDAGDGAIDNGTGVLSVMTAAAALAGSTARPRRTVRVVFFAAEELGLLGSREYVRVHEAAMPNVVAMMNLDMVGAPQGYGATGHDEADTLFARIAQEPQLRDLGVSGAVNHGGGPGSDHQPFLLAGVPTIYVQSSLPPETPLWYHNAADTFDKIDLEALRRTGAAVAAAAWALADHPGRPLRYLTAQETQELIARLGW